METSNVFKSGESDREKVGRFVAGSSLLFVVAAASGVMQFAWSALMQRMLGPEGFGLTGPFLNMFWLLSMTVSFGVPHAMLTFISDRHHRDESGAARVMAEGTRLLFVMAAVVGVLAAAIIVLSGSNVDNVYVGLAWLMIAAVAGKQMYMSFFAVAGGIQRMDLVALCNLVFPVAMLTISVAMAMAVKKYFPGSQTAGVLAGAGGVAGAAVIQCVVSIGMFGRAGVSLKEVYSWRRSWVESGRLLSFGWVAAIAVIASSSVQLISPAVVSFIAHKYLMFGATVEDNARQAGYFSGAFTYALAPLLIVGMVMAIVPAISEAESKKNVALMQRYFDLAVKYALTIIMFMVSIFAVYAGTIVELFSGGDYSQGGMGVLTLTLFAGMSASMLAMLAVNVLVGIKRPTAPAVVSIVMLAALAVVLVAAGALAGSILAAAIAFSAAVFIGLAALLHYLRKLGGIKWPWRMVVRPTISTSATIVVLRLLPYETVSALNVMVACAVGFVCYFTALGLTGGIDADDLDMARDTFRSSGAGIASPAINAAEKFFSLSPMFRSAKRTVYNEDEKADDA